MCGKFLPVAGPGAVSMVYHERDEAWKRRAASITADLAPIPVVRHGRLCHTEQSILRAMLDLATQRKYVPAEQARPEGRCLHADMNRPTPSVDGREMPVPKDNEVLIKVHAVSRNACDSEALRGKPPYSGWAITTGSRTWRRAGR
jgi:hypothetical protein